MTDSGWSYSQRQDSGHPKPQPRNQDVHLLLLLPSKWMDATQPNNHERHLSLWLNTISCIFPSVKWAWFLPVSLWLCGQRNKQEVIQFGTLWSLPHYSHHYSCFGQNSSSFLHSQYMGLTAHGSNCLMMCKMPTEKGVCNVLSSGALQSSRPAVPKL